MVNFKMNDRELSVSNGTTILKAAEQAGIPIPHLCYLKDINEIAACRMCMVEVEGTNRLVPACNTEVAEGMVIHTNSPRVRQARKTNLRLILSQHSSNCTVCVRSGSCELQRLSHDRNMFGAVTKSYFAGRKGINPQKLFVTSIMPCSAKKAEAELPTMRNAFGDPDVDAVLTTREMCRLFRSDCIVPADLEEAAFDSPLGSGTGAAVIFGTTGGVMDAALRSAYYLVTGKNPDPDAFTEVRGSKPWKEASFDIPGAGKVRVAVVSGLANTRKLMEAVDSGEADYDFVEVMACPGGCAGGGGQPIHEGVEMASSRGSQLWKLDARSPIRFSHENPNVQELYHTYLKKPLGEKSHHLLHTDHDAWEALPGKER